MQAAGAPLGGAGYRTQGQAEGPACAPPAVAEGGSASSWGHPWHPNIQEGAWQLVIKPDFLELMFLCRREVMGMPKHGVP